MMSVRKQLLQSYLDARPAPVTELPGAERLHQSLQKEVPACYLSIPADRSAHLSHRAAALLGLIRDSSVSATQISEQLTACSRQDLLHLLAVVRAYRMNGRRARQIGLRSLFQRPDVAEIAAFHRQAVRSLLKHLLGERTWSSVQRAVRTEQPENNRLLQRAVLRFARHGSLALEVLRFLAGVGIPHPSDGKPRRKPWMVIPWLTRTQEETSVVAESAPAAPVLAQSIAARRDLQAGRGMPRRTLAGIRSVFFPQSPFRTVRELTTSSQGERVPGKLTAAFLKALSGAGVPEQLAALSKSIDDSQIIQAQVAVVLDASASMASSGERANHPAALGQAIMRRIESHVAAVTLRYAGGQVGRNCVHPSGQADLATAILNSVAERPDVVLVITDGFENVRQGDTAAVVEGLRSLGMNLPVLQVVPKFSETEDLTDRRLGEGIPVVEICNENAAGDLLARVLLAAFPDQLDDEQAAQFHRLAFS